MHSIRTAGPEDAAAAAEAFRAARQRMTYLPDLHSAAEDRAFIAGRVQAGTALVGVGGTPEAVQAVAWWSRKDDGSWLDGLYVAPTAQGRGFGTALFRAVAELLPEGFHLWVFQANLGARRFYERHGCVLVRLTDGSGNDERTPDALYVWRPGSGR